MVGVVNKRCVYQGCSKQPLYGTEGSRKSEFCSGHKREGMVNVVSKRCGQHGCSTIPSYGTDGSTKTEFCSQHKRAGMVDVVHKRCGHQGCYKIPSFGSESSRKTEFCNQHKSSGMVNVLSKRCVYQGCSKHPSYGTEGSRKTEFCSGHKRPGMVNVVNKQCVYQGCSKQPSYGTEESWKAESCNQHKGPGMVNVVSKRCDHQGCYKNPFFGSEGSRKREFCGEHKRPGMVDVTSKRCGHPGCFTIPSYGREGSRRTEFCSEHKRTGMVDILRKRCASEGCAKYRVHSLDGSRRQALLCARHFTEGHQAGASPVDAGMSTEESKEIGGEAGGHVALPNKRKRVRRVERFPRQDDKVSALVRGSSPTLCFTGVSPLASQGSSDQSRVSASQNPGLDDRGTSRAFKRSTLPGCGGDGVRDLPIESCVGAAKSAQFILAQGVAPTDIGDREVTGSREITASADSALGYGGCGERVDAGDGDVFITSRSAGTERDLVTASSQRRRHTRVPCPFVLEDRRKIASLEQEKREVVVQVRNLRAEVEELKKQVADAAIGRAHALAEATGKVEENNTDIIQALRNELGAVSSSLKDKDGTLDAVCQERKGLRQQVAKIEAQVGSAATKVKAEAAKTEKVKEDLQPRIEALRAELAVTSKGWENTKDDLKQIRQERDALHKKAQRREMADEMPPGTVDGVVEEGDVDDHMGVSELKNMGAGEEAVSPLVSLDMSTVAIKREGYKTIMVVI